MGEVAKIEFEVPPALLVELEARVQTRWLEPWEYPATPAAGVGRPAEGPIKPFFNLLAWHRLRLLEVPEVFTEHWMRRQVHALAPNNEGRLLHTLKYVGLVDASGTPELGLWHMNRADPQDPCFLYRELLRRGYGDLEDLLLESPSWGMVAWWMRSRLDGSEQMVQRRFGFYQHLRLAMHTGVQGYDGLMRESRKANWNALLPPVPSGGPKLILLDQDPLPKVLLKPATRPEQDEPASELQLTLHLPEERPPFLKLVEGGTRRGGSQHELDHRAGPREPIPGAPKL